MVLLRRRLRPRMERGLEAPESDRVSHSCFDEFGQRFARLEHGLKFSSQLWFDADLGYDGGLHARSVLRVGYARNGPRGPNNALSHAAALVEIEAIRFRMDQSGLSVKDLVPDIGPINRVYEVLARKRPLTLNMIRRLTQIVIPRQRTRIAYLQPTCSLWRERQCSNMQTLQVRVLLRSP